MAAEETSLGVSYQTKEASVELYTVLRGRTVGVFYRWCDVLASVAGHPNPAYKGFETLAAARRAYVSGSLLLSESALA